MGLKVDKVTGGVFDEPIGNELELVNDTLYRAELHRLRLHNVLSSLSTQEASQEIIDYVQEYVDILDGYGEKVKTFARSLFRRMEEHDQGVKHYETLNDLFQSMYEEAKLREDLW